MAGKKCTLLGGKPSRTYSWKLISVWFWD